MERIKHLLVTDGMPPLRGMPPRTAEKDKKIDEGGREDRTAGQMDAAGTGTSRRRACRSSRQQEGSPPVTLSHGTERDEHAKSEGEQGDLASQNVAHWIRSEPTTP